MFAPVSFSSVLNSMKCFISRTGGFHVVCVGDIYTTQSFLTIKRHNMASLDLTSIKSSAL